MTDRRLPALLVFHRTGASVALALVLTGALAACATGGSAGSTPGTTSPSTSASSGKLATAQVCQIVGANLTSLALPLLPMLQANPSGAELTQDLSTVRTNTTTLSGLLQADSTTTADPQLAGALHNASYTINGYVTQALNGDQNVNALQSAIQQMTIAVSGLYNYCPQLPKV
jgi:hypothetical protein